MNTIWLRTIHDDILYPHEESCTTFMSSTHSLDRMIEKSDGMNPDVDYEDLIFRYYIIDYTGENTLDPICLKWADLLMKTSVAYLIQKDEKGYYYEWDISTPQVQIITMVSLLRYTQEQYGYVRDFLKEENEYKPTDPDKLLIWYSTYGHSGQSNHTAFLPGPLLKGIYKDCTKIIKGIIEYPGNTFDQLDGSLKESPGRIMKELLGMANEPYVDTYYWKDKPSTPKEKHLYFTGDI